MLKLRSEIAPAAAIAALALLGAPARADILSDNLSNLSAGTEAATGSDWLTSSFGTGSTASTLRSVTLLMSSLGGTGTAQVDLYSDGGLQPGPFVGTLASPGSYSTDLAATTFTTGGLALAADTTYWVVLKGLTGEVDWSWTADDTGHGVGFQDTWASSGDGGNSWFTYDSSPTQMTVVASAVPEPGSMALLGLGLAGLVARRLRREGRPPG